MVLSGFVGDTVGPVRLEPLVSRRTCGFRKLHRSPVPAALHRALTRMSYFRDGHREPPDTQPASPSAGNYPLRLSVDIHVIRHHAVRLSNPSAWGRRLVVL